MSESFGGVAFEVVMKTAEEMEDAGSRYKNLERVLGTGIIFILGKDISETQYVHSLVPLQALDTDTATVGQSCYQRVAKSLTVLSVI